MRGFASTAGSRDIPIDLPLVDLGLHGARPIQFRTSTAVGKLQKKFAKRREAFETEHEDLLSELIPLLPQPDRSAAAAREARIIERASWPVQKKPRYFGSSPRKSRNKPRYFGATR